MSFPGEVARMRHASHLLKQFPKGVMPDFASTYSQSVRDKAREAGVDVAVNKICHAEIQIRLLSRIHTYDVSLHDSSILVSSNDSKFQGRRTRSTDLL